MESGPGSKSSDVRPKKSWHFPKLSLQLPFQSDSSRNSSPSQSPWKNNANKHKSFGEFTEGGVPLVEQPLNRARSATESFHLSATPLTSSFGSPSIQSQVALSWEASGPPTVGSLSPTKERAVVLFDQTAPSSGIVGPQHRLPAPFVHAVYAPGSDHSHSKSPPRARSSTLPPTADPYPPYIQFLRAYGSAIEAPFVPHGDYHNNSVNYGPQEDIGPPPIIPFCSEGYRLPDIMPAIQLPKDQYGQQPPISQNFQPRMLSGTGTQEMQNVYQDRNYMETPMSHQFGMSQFSESSESSLGVYGTTPAMSLQHQVPGPDNGTYFNPAPPGNYAPTNFDGRGTFHQQTYQLNQGRNAPTGYPENQNQQIPHYNQATFQSSGPEQCTVRGYAPTPGYPVSYNSAQQTLQNHVSGSQQNDFGGMQRRTSQPPSAYGNSFQSRKSSGQPAASNYGMSDQERRANEAALLADISSMSISNEPTFRTPVHGQNRVYETTPSTARVTGEYTPVAMTRSQQGQSINPAAKSSLNIDLSKGLPPPFWPGGKDPARATENVVSRSGTYEAPHQNLGLSGTESRESDPFVGGSVNSTAIVPLMKNPFGPVPAPTGPFSLDLLRPQQPTLGESRHLNQILSQGNPPSVDVAFDPRNMPFIEPARAYNNPGQTGLVRITNIPYNITRQEVIAFMGRNARLINDIEEPVHIIMERVTSKTMDAYVEFVNINEAVNAVNRYETNRMAGRAGRLGERHAEMEVVGHDQLMKDLFPKAKNVRWNGSRPDVLPTDPDDKYNSGFQGFISREEVVMLIKHVEAPQRSPFAKDCPQRAYEFFISTLIKYPWNMVDHITMEHRDLLAQATRDLIRLLMNRLKDNAEDIKINGLLLKRFHRAVWNCAGFTDWQKDDIAFYSGLHYDQIPLAPFADHWCCFRVIAAKRNWDPAVIKYYQSLLREATTSAALVSLAERASNPAKGNSVFGNVKVEWPKNWPQMTLAAVGALEWNVIEQLLRKVLQKPAGLNNESVV